MEVQPVRRSSSGYLPIAGYAFLSDCRSSALVGSDGSIDWLCWPRFDSPAPFSAVLDIDRGGSFRLTPVEPSAVTRRTWRARTCCRRRSEPPEAPSASTTGSPSGARRRSIVSSPLSAARSSWRRHATRGRGYGAGAWRRCSLPRAGPMRFCPRRFRSRPRPAGSRLGRGAIEGGGDRGAAPGTRRRGELAAVFRSHRRQERQRPGSASAAASHWRACYELKRAAGDGNELS